MITIIIRSGFEEDDKLYPQVFLDDACMNYVSKKHQLHATANTYKMLEYDRIDILEGIDANKASASKEFDSCHFCYFKDIGFRYELYLYNGFHDLIQKAMGFNNVAIVYVKGTAYRIHFQYMSKGDAISIMNNSHLVDKMGVL